MVCEQGGDEVTPSKMLTIGINAANLRPAHDQPQSLATVTRWFQGAGFDDISVRPGLNGVVGSGRRPDQCVCDEISERKLRPYEYCH